MKICSTCEMEKDFSLFSKSSASKDGYKSQCKSCVSKKAKERRSTEEFQKKNKKYQDSIPEEIKRERKRRYYLKHKEKISEKNKRYRENNKEYFKEYNKKYWEDNKDILLERSKEWRENNKDYLLKWRENNPEKIKEYRDKYLKSESCKLHRKNWYESIKKRKPYVLAWRSVLNNSIKRLNSEKESETIELLGYSAIELKEHLESLFLEGMSWKNYGEWHIDHIKMVSEFDKDTPLNVVNSLDNLRPLWAKDNCSRKLN